MHRYFLLALPLAGVLTAAHAQQVRVGFKAGVTFNRFSEQNISDNTYKTGVLAGGMLNYSLGKHFALQPELLYAMKGSEAILNIGTAVINGAVVPVPVNATYTQTLHYLDLPVLVSYRLGPVFAEAGPQVGVLLGARQTLEVGATTTDTSNSGDFNRFDAGYAVGIGIRDNGLLLGVRYNGGLANINNVTSTTVHNNSFQLYVGYLLGGTDK